MIIETITSIEKAIIILRAIGKSEDGLRIRDIVKKTNIHPTTIVRILKILEKHNFVEKNLVSFSYKTYSLGNNLIQLTNSAIKRNNLSNIVYPFMVELAEKYKETIALFVMNGLKRVCINKVDGYYPIRWHIEIGNTIPLGVSSSGKLLLAFAPEHLLEEVIKKKITLTDGRVVNYDKLKKDLEKIRMQGYSFSIAESTPEVIGISVPIRNNQEKVVAAMTFLIPITRNRTKYIEELKDAIMVSAKRISGHIS
jgi:DNA-binding IclR family transcriptional regulator